MKFDDNQIERAAFISKIVQTKKFTSAAAAAAGSVKPKKVVHLENERKKIHFKPEIGASPVAMGPPISRVSYISLSNLLCSLT